MYDMNTREMLMEAMSEYRKSNIRGEDEWKMLRYLLNGTTLQTRINRMEGRNSKRQLEFHKEMHYH